MTHVLLVSPAFHGYWRAVAAALEARGHEVSTHLYDRAGLAERARTQAEEARCRLGGDVAAGRRARHTRGAIEALRATSPGAVVVVKGDTLDGGWWAELERRRTPRVTWLYDELRRTDFTAERLAAAGPLASYSPADVAALRADGGDHEVRHLPLAFDHRLAPRPRPVGPGRDEVVFVGARYPRREDVLRRLAAAGHPVRAFGRDWSRHPVDRLRTWGLRRPPLPAARDVDRATAYAVMRRARAVLNIHGDQDGLTMRTFEASGAGGLQLVDRDDLGELYEPGAELVAYSSLGQLESLLRRAASDTQWSDRVRAAGRARTLAHHTFDHRVAVLEQMWA